MFTAFRLVGSLRKVKVRGVAANLYTTLWMTVKKASKNGADGADMEPNLLKYIWRNSKAEQVRILILVLVSLPFYYLSLNLPKDIVNRGIQGRGFDGPVFLVRQQTHVEMRSLEIGEAEVTLRESIYDPWAEIELEKTLMAFYLVSDNAMQPGEVVAEVDPQAYLPYSFKGVDFFAG